MSLQASPRITLSETNTYGGATTLSAGTLLVNGNDAAAGGAVAVNGGMLGGSGSVGGTVAVNAGGTVTGGTLGGVGTLTVGGLTFDGGTFAVDFNGNTSDTVATAGAINLNAGTAGVFATNSQSGTASFNNVFTLIDNTGVSGIANSPLIGASEGGTAILDAVHGHYTYIGGNGQSFTFDVTPFVTASTASLPANATTITIHGTGFDPTAADNSIVFDDGAVGSVTAATPTSLTVTFSAPPTVAGSLTAVVITDGVASCSPVQVATVTPVVTADTAGLAADGTSLTITGFGFDPTVANDAVTFNDGVVGSVSAATPTSLTVTFSTPPTTAGSLTAVVTTDGVASGSPVRVATVIPVVTTSAADLAANAATLMISGFGFDPTVANDSVAFDDGASGTVTAATPTSLTVTFSTLPTTASGLTAVVTIDGVSSGAPVQVATVTPVVTAGTAVLAANGTSLTIAGFGFDPTTANNAVTFNDGVVGSVTAATPTSLTVTLTTNPTKAGNLTAVVATGGMSSGSPVQVATVTPVVTADTAGLAADGTSLTITGFGFDPTAANNAVTFNDGVVGSVTAATPTSLTVDFSAPPTTAGSLTAVVTTDGVPSGSSVQVATVTPVVTAGTASLPANVATITLTGFGFDPTAANNSVTFGDGAVGSVTAATPTSLTVTFSAPPTVAGSLTAVVITDGVASGSPVRVATVTPVVTADTAGLAADGTSLTIAGFGFDPTAANNAVTFNDGVVGSVTAATPTSLTVTFSTRPMIVGSLTAVVATDGVSSGTPVQVATVIPVVTTSAADLAANTATLTIAGFGFDPTVANDSVTFNDGVVGSVSVATTTSLTVTFAAHPTTAGSLTAVVTTGGVSSGTPVQVATVMPVVTSSVADLAANGTSLTITGFGFDPSTANNTVTFDGGAIGSVTAATPTSLTVTLSTAPTTAGSLTAVVTTGGVSSGSPVQVATVTPVVTAGTADLAANGTSLTITGFGFDPTAANNAVTFNDGVVGSVTAATPTSLTVDFSAPPTTAGSLTAVVTTDGVPSGSSVQVATVTPVVTAGTASLPANVATITLTGFGFDPTAANNSVTFGDGAVGSVTAATPTSLTVTFSAPPTVAGSLTAVVITDGVASGSPVRVATVTPVVTADTAGLAADGTSLTIAGFGFDPTAANNAVTFNDGVVGSVTAATPTSLTVTFSTRPMIVGSLTAVVATDGVSSGSPVQVATVTPVVTSSVADLAANAATLTIAGFGFDPTAADNSVAFDDGAIGSITAATSTSLTVTFAAHPTTAGNLTAVVTTGGVPSGSPIQVATVTPVVTTSTAVLAANGTSLTITGFGFDLVTANNTVTFNDGAVGSVMAATPTSLTVTFAAHPTTAGSLTAVVTTGGVSSGSPVQVATVTPVVTAGTADLAANGTSLTITGFGFDPSTANNTVTFDGGAIGSVTAATPTSLTVTLSTAPTTAGSLTAVVTTGGVSSGSPVQVATVTPVVTSGVVDLAANAVTLTISGFGFDPTATNDTVTFDGGAIGSVTAATPTSLTVTLSVSPTVGRLTVVVTTDGVSSGNSVQVATVIAVPTANAQSLATAENTPTSLTLTGSDPNAPVLPLTYTVTVAPTHGTLAGTAPDLIYTPAAGYFGPDSFQFTTSNGTTTSPAATVTLTVIAAPAVTVVSPPTGPTAGGTLVTISGANFDGATAVMFGPMAASGFTINSANSISATVPAGTTGSVDVTVVTAGGTSAISAADRFAYVGAPVVSGVSPSTGLATGGTTVTITGTNLSDATTVDFGGVEATIVSDTATQVVATSPAGTAGVVDVTVTTVGGTSVVSSADQFIYAAVPPVSPPPAAPPVSPPPVAPPVSPPPVVPPVSPPPVVPPTSPPPVAPPVSPPPATVPPTTPRATLVGYPQFAVGADVGGTGMVTVYNPDQSVAYTATPFGASFTAGVRVAVADFNGDGVPDLVAGTGPGVTNQIVVLDGKTHQQLASFSPFETTFTGGIFVTVGDVSGDGVPDLIVTPDQSGGRSSPCTTGRRWVREKSSNWPDSSASPTPTSGVGLGPPWATSTGTGLGI
ncbi:FG-GAP repeat domain-containing protein [Fimbriiglobus ruber]|uniref:IPT/TIG domain-containing protein n=1 Tax=Fimbriiglobus ruber TaxID=1908690 RepID=A0A225DQ46_9BACT|nr:VCBS repeat-containing protein [Fimbriiglobus ruber]OWK43391.1 hypothetical protein FRUB_02990 [Fimbriiglobus ruber]